MYKTVCFKTPKKQQKQKHINTRIHRCWSQIKRPTPLKSPPPWSVYVKIRSRAMIRLTKPCSACDPLQHFLIISSVKVPKAGHVSCDFANIRLRLGITPALVLFISFPPCLLHLPAIIAASSQLHCCCLLLPFVSPPPTVMYHHIFYLSAASSLIFSSFSSSSLTSSPRSPPLTS